MLRRVAILLALFGCSDKAAPPPASPAKVEAKAPADAAVKDHSLADLLEAIRAEHKLPALAAAVWRDGKLVEMEAVGLRKADDPTSKVTTKDLWHLGSNTKAMTATLIAIFVDRGVLHWDDTIGKAFKNVDPAYAPITLDQLLHHESGAPAQPPPELWHQLWTDSDQPDARAKFVQGLLARPPAQKVGTFVYSNASYMIAGAMLEKATGKRWEDLMRDELFAKLDMKSCGFGAPGHTDPVDQPWGHDASGTPIAPGPKADNPPGLGPAGTVHCSLEDYGKFLALHSTGQPALVSPESLQHLHTASSASYGGGWIVRSSSPYGSFLGHSGSNTMWLVTAAVMLTNDPKDHLVLVMATNKGDLTVERDFIRLLDRHIKRK